MGDQCLTESMILKRAQKNNIESIKRVNLWGLHICDASFLHQVPTLAVVSLSSNNISDLSAFSDCVHLKELYLRNNLITDLSEVQHLSKLPYLHILFLLGNPCCYPPDANNIDTFTETTDYYRPTVIRHIPPLERLDLRSVSEVEKMSAAGCVPAPVEDIKGQSPPREYNSHDSGDALVFETSSFPPINDITPHQEPESLDSVRRRISALSVATKQTLADILHLLPRLNADALALLAREIDNRRRQLEGPPNSPVSDAGKN